MAARPCGFDSLLAHQLIIYLVLILAVLIVILIFSSKHFSPVPYFPTNKKDLKLVIKALNLRNNQTVVDLGAGDGLVIFEAAKEAAKRNLNTKFIAVELNPILVLILHLRRLFNPNKQNIRIIYGDMFKINLSNVILVYPESGQARLTVYLYISPWLMDKLYKKLKVELKSFNLVSYYYPLPKVKPSRIISGKNKIYLYGLI